MKGRSDLVERHKTILHWTIIASLLVSSIMVLSACKERVDADAVVAAPGPEERAETLPPARVAGVEAPRGEGELRIAVAPVISPEETLVLYRDLVDYVAKQVSLEGVMLQRLSYSETNTLIRQRLCDVAFVCTYAYVQGKKDFGMELMVVPSVMGKTEYHSQFIVSTGSDATSLLDLKNLRFASADPLSNTGWLYPAYFLYNEGIDHDNFFSEVMYTGGHDRAIMAVANGVADGAAVDSLVLDQLLISKPGLESKVRVIHTSVAYGMPPVVVHPAIDPTLRAQLREALLTMHESPEGAAALALLQIDRFLPPDPTKYELVEKMMGVVESRP
jgi:phosphonate transport system substrate-binding protein